MKINWPNVFASVFGIVALVLLLRHWPFIITSLQQIGPGHGAKDQAVGLLALGLICVSILTVVRLLTRK